MIVEIVEQSHQLLEYADVFGDVLNIHKVSDKFLSQAKQKVMKGITNEVDLSVKRITSAKIVVFLGDLFKEF